jgi:uncharacterized protein YeaO (DUF488 family)
MPIHIVRLGSQRLPREGVRIGTVRRPPRGVSKERYAKDNWYDVWYPELSPTLQLMAQAKSSQSESEWQAFVRQFRKQMREPAASRTLDLLSALSQSVNFSLGCTVSGRTDVIDRSCVSCSRSGARVSPEMGRNVRTVGVLRARP